MINLILSVDDDYPTNLYNQLVLKEAKVTDQVVTLFSGKEAMEYLQQETNTVPEVLLLDLNMPLMNGWEVLDALMENEDQRLVSMKIFLLTSSPIIDDIERVKKHPMVNGVLMKPLKTERLLEML
ncbi:MAG: hypothetical protein CMB99_03365 [Flavobacteriaceae bacterium]|nr:hypothetical protein [Flavobacteriaceae bacterium]|tara:strand:+ start:1939 stop:2313 length:375 start_codon:yes stop_codon:yes gene_type:complete